MFLSNVGALLRLAVPMIVSRAGLAAMAIVDAVMVSRYSSNQFAMLGLADGTLGRLSDVFGAFVIMLLGAGLAVKVFAILPFAMVIAMYALELLVAVLQAYVFAMLTCMYLADALHPGH